MGKRATPVEVSERQQIILQRLAQASTTGQDLAIRARIVLMSAAGVKTLDQAMAVRVHPERVSRWRVRWASAHQRLAAAEGETNDKDLKALVVEVLSDRPRCGGPTTFTPEQVTDIIALACEKPNASGLPVSHWTPADVAREAIKRGIVESISPRHVDRYLKRSRAQTAQEPLLADVAGQKGRPRAIRPGCASDLRDLSTSSAARATGHARREQRRKDRHSGPRA